MEDTPIVLLGAGASKPAGIPTATEMTKRMIESDPYASSPMPFRREELRVIRFVTGGLAMKKGIEGENPLNGINIEDLFTAIRMLSKKDSLQISPFVAQWHGGISEIDERIKHNKPFRGSRLESAISSALSSIDPSSSKYRTSLDEHAKAIRKEIDRYISGNSTGIHSDNYHKTEAHMIKALADLVWVEEKNKVSYLEPLLRCAIHDNIVISTLNYDNVVELCADSLDLQVDIKIDYDDTSYREIELIKLHGSIDWNREVQGLTKEDPRLFKMSKVKRLNDDESPKSNDDPAIIFGTGNKLTEEGPFLNLFRLFQQRIQ